MALARRELVAVGVAAGLAALAGGVAGPMWLQSRSGAAELLAASYPDLEGKPRRLIDWRGRVLVCNFWATWCAPCREEMPLLAETRRRYVPKGVEIVGIGIDHADKIRDFVKSLQIAYPVLVADGSALDLMARVGTRARALPYTVFLDRPGGVVHR